MYIGINHSPSFYPFLPEWWPGGGGRAGRFPGTWPWGLKEVVERGLEVGGERVKTEGG